MFFHNAIGLSQYPSVMADRPASVYVVTAVKFSWDAGLVLVENCRHKSTDETKTEHNSIPIILSLNELNSSFTHLFSLIDIE